MERLAFAVTVFCVVVMCVANPVYEGLYKGEKNVFILNNKNFEDQVLEKENAWLVEFYASWCGHCQRFVPIWKEIAKNVSGWKSVLKLGALDCAEDNNVEVCRTYEVEGFPTIRFFHPQSTKNNLGAVYKKSIVVNENIDSLTNLVLKEYGYGNTTNWPDLNPYSEGSTADIWDKASTQVQNIAFIFEEEESLVGAQVILDLSDYEEIMVRRVSSGQNSALAAQFNVQSTPRMVVLERPLTRGTVMHLSSNTRKDFTGQLLKIINKEEDVSDNDRQDTRGSEHEHKEPVLNERNKIVFQVDLENAIIKSFKKDVAAKKVINDEKMEALKRYLKVLRKYFPKRNANSVEFLEQMNKKVSSQTSVKGEEVENIFKNYKTHDWIGCQGSQPQYRGYPCGVWTMFHTLTVNAVLDNPEVSGQEVLQAMHGFVKYFLGCEDCSQHFQAMASRRQLNNVTMGDESILWLWEAHNEVNKRLSGDDSEDPVHPKIQFPSKDQCTVCRNADESWNRDEVLKYLKNIYSKDNISMKNIAQILVDQSSRIMFQFMDSVLSLFWAKQPRILP